MRANKDLNEATTGSLSPQRITRTLS